ncbi:MAG: hypothetical protein KC668_06415 [Myxococcales bacterium]|nr:hypothetical protein [Myxococcales bacterium]
MTVPPLLRPRARSRSLVLLVALASCSSPAGTPLGGPAPVAYAGKAQPPAILRDVSMIDDDNQWNNPFVPGLRTTMDGRVALRVQGGPSTLSFYLFRPESLDEPILTSPAGAHLLADTTPVQVVLPPAAEPNLLRVGHHAICDPTQEFPVDGEQPNPYACGADLANDCYDITVISSISQSFRAVRMWGTPVTVEVASPKTRDANIVRVELGASVQGVEISLSPEFAEVAVTNDGRLLTGRVGGAARYWTNPNTGEELLRSYDLMYSVLPSGADPCDITAWTDFHPMSHAPFDPNMRHYGLAAYPFRDTEGRLIGDGEDMGGSYPWVDREGSNMFMTGVPGYITEQSEEDFPRRCVVEGCEQFTYAMDFDRGFLVAGLWTHGKLVHLDARINNVDWSVGSRPDAHYLVDLYEDEQGDPVAVRFGAGRGLGTSAPGYPGNENILDSLQNMLNHHPAARPITPRDVVWVMSSGVATDEVVFDDFLDPRAFIVSNMQASVTQLLDYRGFSTGVPVHWNGQHRDIGVNLGISNQRSYRLDHMVDEDVHIQNAATSLGFQVPPYGLVEAGTGRTEPVALGGFYGRGFWLDGTNRIAYEVPAQAEPLESDWYIGLFVDVRSADGATRSLLSFPDGSSVRLVDRDTLQYVRDERVMHAVTLPESSAGWVHLGWNVRDRNRELTLLVDGFPFDRFDSGRPFFLLPEGTLALGRGPDRLAGDADAGVRGWVDDFKVLAHDVDLEIACNHAGGTLVALSGDTLASTAAIYPEWAHAEVAQSVRREAGGRYACFHDYSADNAATLANIPAGAESLRNTIIFPEGPLRAGVPRPDSSDNAFCLSCHSSSGVGPMGLEALALHPGVNLEDDPRRQPHQPPRRVFGNIPGGWIPAGEGEGSPDEPMRAPPEGVLIDRWVLAH